MSDYDNWKCDDSAYRQDAPEEPPCPADATANPVDCICGGEHGHRDGTLPVGVGRAHELQSLRAQVAALTTERDLAIAHDRQPYPTAHAYEQACKALAKHRSEAERLSAKVAALTEERDAANYAYHYSSAEVTRLRAALEAAPYEQERRKGLSRSRRRWRRREGEAMSEVSDRPPLKRVTVEIGSHNELIVDKAFGPWVARRLRITLDVSSGWQWVIERDDMAEDALEANWVTVAAFDADPGNDGDVKS